MDVMTETAQQLADAGWVLARNGTKHEIWRCPCGRHQLSVSRPGSKGNALPALQITQKRIRQCARARQEATA